LPGATTGGGCGVSSGGSICRYVPRSRWWHAITTSQATARHVGRSIARRLLGDSIGRWHRGSRHGRWLLLIGRWRDGVRMLWALLVRGRRFLLPTLGDHRRSPARGAGRRGIRRCRWPLVGLAILGHRRGTTLSFLTKTSLGLLHSLWEVTAQP